MLPFYCASKPLRLLCAGTALENLVYGRQPAHRHGAGRRVPEPAPDRAAPSDAARPARFPFSMRPAGPETRDGPSGAVGHDEKGDRQP